MVSTVISPLTGVISIVTLVLTLLTKSHDPLSRVQHRQIGGLDKSSSQGGMFHLSAERAYVSTWRIMGLSK